MLLLPCEVNSITFCDPCNIIDNANFRKKTKFATAPVENVYTSRIPDNSMVANLLYHGHTPNVSAYIIKVLVAIFNAHWYSW